jgi:hypothetical protein
MLDLGTFLAKGKNTETPPTKPSETFNKGPLGLKLIYKRPDIRRLRGISGKFIKKLLLNFYSNH